MACTSSHCPSSLLELAWNEQKRPYCTFQIWWPVLEDLLHLLQRQYGCKNANSSWYTSSEIGEANTILSHTDTSCLASTFRLEALLDSHVRFMDGSALPNLNEENGRYSSLIGLLEWLILLQRQLRHKKNSSIMQFPLAHATSCFNFSGSSLASAGKGTCHTYLWCLDAVSFAFAFRII